MKVIITESFGVGLCNDVEGSSRPQGRPKARSKGLKEAESADTLCKLGTAPLNESRT